jgi:Flp pilus assembly protein TadG
MGFLFRKTRTKRFKGQALLELALTLPIFMILVIGVFEVGRLVFIYSSVLTASREAAR